MIISTNVSAGESVGGIPGATITGLLILTYRVIQYLYVNNYRSVLEDCFEYDHGLFECCLQDSYLGP